MIGIAALQYLIHTVNTLLVFCWQHLQWCVELVQTCAASCFSSFLSMATSTVGPDQQCIEQPTDAHWDTSVKDKPFRTPGRVLQHLKQATYTVSTGQAVK